MPTITIRVSADEKAALEAAARRARQTVSDYVREAVEVRKAPASLTWRVEQLEQRVTGLERGQRVF